MTNKKLTKALRKRRATPAQRNWLRDYELATTFEPLMDDWLAGNETFEEMAKKSIQWFQDWASETHHAIGNYPE